MNKAERYQIPELEDSSRMPLRSKINKYQTLYLNEPDPCWSPAETEGTQIDLEALDQVPIRVTPLSFSS